MAQEAQELAQGSRATARYMWVSASKARQVASLITGKHVDEARRILAFSPKAVARTLSKVLESAIANAEHNHQIPQEELFVRSAWADEGPTHSRWRPRARRAAYVIRKRTSHINVIVQRMPEEYLQRQQPARRRRAERPVEAATPTEGEDEKPARKTRAKGAAKAKATTAKRRTGGKSKTAAKPKAAAKSAKSKPKQKPSGAKKSSDDKGEK